MTLPPAPPQATITAKQLAAMVDPPQQPTAEDHAALKRLIAHAQGDTHQSRRVADFLLAWWNSAECGAFDLTSLWAVDSAIVGDMVTVFGLIAKAHRYPDTLGYDVDFKAIMRHWRPR